MWVSTNKTFNNAPMFFQFCRKDDLCIFSFTNMKQLYSKQIHETSFATVFSPTNKIEVDVKNVVGFLENIVETCNVNYNFYPDNVNVKTDLTITLSEGFPPFKLELGLELKDESIFFNTLTCPLLKIIKQLKQNQEDLFNIIRAKDLEISEYKLLGGNITHENIKTDIFEKHNFFMNTLLNNKDLCNESLQLYEIYSSPLIEQYNTRYFDEHKESKNIKEENQEIQIINSNNSFDCKASKSSTTIEITQKSINVKKRKNTSFLKNL